MDWIPVQNRFPPYNQQVLSWSLPHAADSDKAGQIQIAYYTTSENTFTTLFGIAENVTHWMPLPAPPVDKQFESVKFAADSIMSQYIPSDNFLNDFSFDIILEKTSYKIFYEKGSDGYWEFKNYRII